MRTALEIINLFRPRLPVILPVIALAIAPAAAGQWYGKRNATTTPPAQEDRPAPPETPTAESPAPSLAPGWSIVLELHSGPDAADRARARLAPVSIDAGRSDVHVRPTARGVAIVAGSYSTPDSPEARADLDAVRARVIGGKRPFFQAFFAPPKEPVDPGRVPELNLLAAKQVFGKGKEYTLQIAFYQSKKPDEAKRAAEKAALQLRREGELAFYYHGSTMSLVTVGVFSDADFDKGLNPKNPAILALQARYPLNLHNGEFPVIEKRPGEADRQQPSQLVQIP